MGEAHRPARGTSEQLRAGARLLDAARFALHRENTAPTRAVLSDTPLLYFE
jgi:hypothetical protein